MIFAERLVVDSDSKLERWLLVGAALHVRGMIFRWAHGFIKRSDEVNGRSVGRASSAKVGYMEALVKA